MAANPPQIRIAEEAGACYGVERALQMVESAAAEGVGSVHTLGPLIHNPRVIAELAAQGVDAVESPEEAAGDTLLLRTHGTVPEEEARARDLCARVLDATCPFVKKVHQAAERLSREGYQVVVVGEAGHPEVEATLPHAPGAVVVGSAEEAAALPHVRKVGVVVQTTARRALLAEVVSELLGVADLRGHGRAPSRGRRARARGRRHGGDRRANLGKHHAPRGDLRGTLPADAPRGGR